MIWRVNILSLSTYPYSFDSSLCYLCSGELISNLALDKLVTITRLGESTLRLIPRIIGDQIRCSNCSVVGYRIPWSIEPLNLFLNNEKMTTLD